MIRYDLKCADGHEFEAWFASGSAYDDLAQKGLLSCSICGGGSVEKALMAPRVPRKGNAASGSAQAGAPSDARPMLNAPVPPEIEAKLAALRNEVQQNSDYVGKGFANEARRIHAGETEARSIWGEATGAEAKSLIEDGVPVAPLPVKMRHDS